MYIPIGPSKNDLYKIIIGLLLIIYLIFLGMYKPKAFTYNIEVTKNRDVVFGARSLSVYPFGGQTGNLEVKYDNLNHYVSCNTSTCGVEYYFDASYITNNASTQTIDIIAMTAQLDAPGYPVCSVVNGTISCIVSNTITIKGLSIYFPLTSANMNWTVNTNLIGNYTIFDVPSTTSSAITSISNDTSNISNNLNDSSIDSSSANDLTSNSAFQDSNGLDAIIKAPLNFIQSLTSSTCSAINLTIPYIDADVILPCMSTIYNKALGQQLVNLIALVINGIVLYRYCLKILQIVKDAKNPNKDGLEVLDL